MSTEAEGFPSEPDPVFPMAEAAENQVLRERLYAAQNALVRLENEPGAPLDPCTRCNGSGSEPDTDPDEAAGLVLVAREDVKRVLAAIACYMPLGMVDEEQHAVLARLRDAAGGRTDAAVGDADHAGSPEAHASPEGRAS